jgi:hypothetical protein
MIKENAVAAAQQHANQNGEPYCAIRARNGQWMRERLAFVESPRGQGLYPPHRERIVFNPQVTQ